MDENILATEIAALKEYPNAQLISSNFYIWHKNNEITLQTDENDVWNKYFDQANKTGELLCLENPVNCFLEDTVLTRTGVFLINSGLFKYVGYFDEHLKSARIGFCRIKLAGIVGFMIYVPKPLMTYRYRAGSLTNRGLPTSLWDITAYKRLLNLNNFKDSIRQKLEKKLLNMLSIIPIFIAKKAKN